LITCPNCHRGNPGDRLFCQFCSAELTPLASSEGLKKELQSLKLEINRLLARVKAFEEKQHQHQSVLFDYIDRLFHPEKSHPEPLEQPTPAEPAPEQTSAPVYGGPQLTPAKETAATPPPGTEAGPAADDSWKHVIGGPQAAARPGGSKPPEVLLSQSKAPAPAGTEVQFGQKWLLILGVITVIFGVGYFVKYSFDQNWVDPTGRVALAYLLGVAFLGAGAVFRRKKLTAFGTNLYGAGFAVFYVATYAALNLYNLMDSGVAFLVMVVITALTCGFALAYDAVLLAVLGAIGGFLTPFLAGFHAIEVLNLFAYLAILNIGLLLISLHKRWAALQYVGFVFTWITYAIWYAQSYRIDQFWPALLFANLFFLIYAFMPFAYFFLRERTESLGGIPISFLNSLVAFSFDCAIVTGVYPHEYLSALTLAYAAMFILMARFLRTRNEANLEPYVLLLSKGIFFLTLSFPLLLSKQWVTLFWGIQSVVLFGVANRIKKGLLVGWALVVFFLTILKFYLFDWYGFGFNWLTFSYQPDYWTTALERFVTLALVLRMLWVGNRFMDKLREWYDPEIELRLAGKAAFIICLFVTLNMETGAFCHQYAPNARFAIISVLWALFSVALMIIGFAQAQSSLRMVAIGLFCFTLVKVFLFDMGDVATPYRVLSFIGLGLLLIGASYLYYRFEKQVDSQ
jgi:uncharacterized membrane protein